MKVDLLDGVDFVEIDDNDLSTIVVEGKEVKGQARKLAEILPLVYERGVWLEDKSMDMPLYYMFRDVCKDKDREKIVENKLRYDITIMLPIKLGKEFVKTAGHYHPLVPGTNVSYPELYEILEGKAIFILQRVDGAKVLDAVVVKAQKGDKVVVPPNYGHVMVNVGYKPLITANWVSREFGSIYQPYRDRKGAVYYVISKFMDVEFVVNEAYDNVKYPPTIYRTKANDVLGVDNKQSMYGLVEEIEKLEFLNKPQNYMEIMDKSVVFEVISD